ncbi:MAG: DUF695 domain-containing protein [Acidimicrobiales bacterium]
MTPTVASVGDRGWRVAQGAFDGHPVIVRCNPGFRGAIDRAEWPIRIGVAFPLRAPDTIGWPSRTEGDELGRAEDEIVRLAADRAVIVAVITVNGVRELVLHARESGWIEQFHREAREAIATHEVQVVAERDPDWEVFEDLVGSLLA